MLLTQQQIVSELSSLVRQRGGDLRGLGGDCFALCIANEIRALVAPRDFATMDKRFVVNVPRPLLDIVTGDRVIQGLDTPTVYRAFVSASLVHFRTLVHLPIVASAARVLARTRANMGALREDFTLELAGPLRYVISGGGSSENVPVGYIDSFNPIVAVLDMPRAELEDA